MQDTKLIKIDCPIYKFDKELNLEAVSNEIDQAILANFAGKNIVLRGIQSQKHSVPKDELINQILQSGTDRLDSNSDCAVEVNDKLIDLFGYACKVDKSPFVLPVLEGFHKWKPKSLERPQTRVDIWMIYDAKQLENIEYFHKTYKVKVNDGYRFINPSNKTQTLIGLVVVE